MKSKTMEFINGGLRCFGTGDDLLEPGAKLSNLIIVYGEENSPHRVVDFLWCEKSFDSDLCLSKKYSHTGSNEIRDLKSPQYYLYWFWQVFSNIKRDRAYYSDRALEKMQYLFCAFAPHVFRDVVAGDTVYMPENFEEALEKYNSDADTDYL